MPSAVSLIAKKSGEEAVELSAKRDERIVRKIEGLAYAGTDNEKQKLDLYLPKGDGIKVPMPLIIWIHGGGFFEGTRAFCPLTSLTEKGYAVASISYRLAPKSHFPAQIDDCREAVRWLQAHAAEYGIDPERVGVCGESAGGLLAELLGVTSTPEDSNRIKAVAALCAPSNMTVRKVTEAEIVGLFASNDPKLIKQAEGYRWEERVLRDFLGGPIEEKEDVAKAASPFFHVSPDDVPSILIHGDKDELVPLSQSEIFVEALRSHQVPVEFHVIKGAGHGFGRPSETVLNLIQEFFDRYLVE